MFLYKGCPKKSGTLFFDIFFYKNAYFRNKSALVNSRRLKIACRYE